MMIHLQPLDEGGDPHSLQNQKVFLPFISAYHGLISVRGRGGSAEVAGVGVGVAGEWGLAHHHRYGACDKDVCWF